MEYVIYLSKNKIDMLYDQISSRSPIYKVEGHVNMGVVTGQFTKNDNKVENYFQKLEMVIEKIDGVGDVFDEDISYITGTMDMHWDVLSSTPDATLWYGEDANINCHSKVLLIGSTSNAIGNAPSSNVHHYSPLAYFIHAYAKEIEIKRSRKEVGALYKDYFLDGIFGNLDIEFKYNPISLATPYRFLAKVLCQRRYEGINGIVENYVIASPLYVSVP